VNPDIALLEQQAREKLPAASYDYYAGGAGLERTLRANERSWRRTWLAPRVLRDVSSVDTTTRLLGTSFPTPIGVAPTAFHSLAHPDAEVATAAGAARAGALFVLSFRSTRRIEDVAAAVSAEGGTWWFQVYMMRDRARTQALVHRAAAAGARALVLTGDTPVVGRKRRDSDDLTISDEDALANLGPVDDFADIDQSAAVTLADIGWLTEISGGLPVVVKGVLRADDAIACAAAGAAAVLVSNHGGRQLDGAIPAAWALPGVAAALGSVASPGVVANPGAASPRQGQRGEVPAFVDGGIRRGEDALAALAMGAGAVLVGRPVLWARTCGGADGVAELLTGLTDGLSHAMALAGAPALADVAGLACAPGQGRPR
jgi:4-hydroxymandelate oxidase